MTTTAHKIAHLEQYGFTVGDRYPRLNTAHEVSFMVVEATSDDIGDYALPTADGSNGPWCVVGDDLEELVGDAHGYLLSMATDETDKIDATWDEICRIPESELPARSNLSLEPAPAPSI